MTRILKFHEKVAIIGAGPAGIAAAIQLKRMGIEPRLFEKEKVGGLLNNAYIVENYPGFPEGIAGQKLAGLFKRHLSRWKIRVINQIVLKVMYKNGLFMVKALRRTFAFRFLIVASGTKPKLPEDIFSLPDKRILFEIYPIHRTKNKRIVIVGAGDAAFDYALNLARHNQVSILNRRATINALPLLYERIKNNCHIQYYKNTRISSIKELNNCLIVQVSRTSSGMRRIVCDYLVFAIGREAELDFMSPALRKRFPNGNDQYLYFIGDVRSGSLRQSAIAVGDGVRAAMRVNEVVKEETR